MQVGTMAEMEQYPQEWREYKPIQPRGTDWRGLFRKLWAPLAAIGAFLAKFGAVLFKAKFLFSMFVSAAVYVWLGGWWFGIGLIVLLFVHEMGHVLEAKRQGLPVSAPFFIPLLGGASEMWGRWKMRHPPETQAYYRVSPWRRVAMTVMYFGLAALLVLAMH